MYCIKVVQPKGNKAMNYQDEVIILAIWAY